MKDGLIGKAQWLTIGLSCWLQLYKNAPILQCLWASSGKMGGLFLSSLCCLPPSYYPLTPGTLTLGTSRFSLIRRSFCIGTGQGDAKGSAFFVTGPELNPAVQLLNQLDNVEFQARAFGRVGGPKNMSNTLSR